MDKLTATQQQELLAKIAGYVADNRLGKAHDVSELRTFCRQLGIKIIDRGGVETPISKARKAELVDSLTIAVTPKQVEIEAEQTGLDTDAIRSLRTELEDVKPGEYNDVAISVYKQIYRYTMESWNPAKQIWEDVSSQNLSVMRTLDSWLTNYRQNNGKELALSTRAYYPGKIHEICLDVYKQSCKESEHYSERIEFNIQQVFKNWKKSLKPVTQQVNQGNNDSIKQRQQSRLNANRVINPVPLIMWAKNVLTNLSDDHKRGYYKDVVIALSIALGRREAETMGIGSTFTAIDSRTIKFHGQLKTTPESIDGVRKRWQAVTEEPFYYDENDCLTLPTVIDTDLILKGFQWLKDDNKLGTPKEVNSRWSGELSAHLRSPKMRAILELAFPNGLGDFEFTMHKFRSMYAETCYVLHGHGFDDFIDYCYRVLGHGFDDTNSTKRYGADFRFDESIDLETAIENI